MNDWQATNWCSEQYDGHVERYFDGFVAVVNRQTDDDEPFIYIADDDEGYWVWEFNSDVSRFICPTFNEAALRVERFRLKWETRHTAQMTHNPKRNDESEFNALLCAGTIASVDNNSDENLKMQRARVHFKNGHSLSIIRGPNSYGGEDGLFEIMPSDESFLDEEHSGDSVCGYLTAEQVERYIRKIGEMGV